MSRTEEKSRYEERDELLTELGLLVDPIRRLDLSSTQDRKKIPYIRAQFENELAVFLDHVTACCRAGEMTFQREASAVSNAVTDFHRILKGCQTTSNNEFIKVEFPKCLKRIQDAIRAIPCDDPGKILPSKSPYTTYLRLRAICGAAKNSLDLFDPWLDASTFHRYFPRIEDTVNVTIVTSSKLMVSTASTMTQRDIQRRDRIIAISELLANQYPNNYQFRVSSQPHDRHLRVDGDIFHLGGSVKDAGDKAYFTISNLDPTQSNDTFLDGVIAGADEWFGQSVTTHRRQ